MTCAQTRDLLPLYLDEILDRRDLDAVAHHLERCSECLAWLQQQDDQIIAWVPPDVRLKDGGVDPSTAAHEGLGRVQRAVRALTHGLGW